MPVLNSQSSPGGKSVSRHLLRPILFLAGACLLVSGVSSAESFRWAGTTDPQTLDPHASNTTPVLGFLNNVYEGLVRRDKGMAIEPALATHWEALGEDGWRFTLREGVRFHDGAELTADDVLFSYERASSEEADTSSWFAPISEVRVVDDFTIDFLTTAPNPLFPSSIANFMIMDRQWSEGNDAARPSKEAENFATRNTNGTGAFTVTDRDPGVRTELEPFDGWWDENESNITRAVFTPIAQSATGMAALLSGEVDFIAPIPLQDVPRMQQRDGFKVYEGIEARVIFFGFNHDTDALKFSSDIKGKNPFQDVRVRQAAYQSIDVDALVAKIMRGNAQPVSQLVSSRMSGYSTAHEKRLAYDPEAARALLAEAGYPKGFSFGLQCPNDRYINDESICKAAASMMAKVGLKARLSSMPVRNYWPELRADNFDMYLLGWSPGTFDVEHPIRFLAATPDEQARLGSWNFGGYSNERIDELLPVIQTELDEVLRQESIDEITRLIQEEVAYVPLYVQPLVWASTDSIELTQRSDDFFILRWVSVN